MNYHSLEIHQILLELKTSADGLNSKEAEKRLQEYGPNEIKEGKPVSAFKIFIAQFKSLVVWILIVAVIISAFLGEYIDAIVILAILLLIGVLGFVQEYKAERSIGALKKLISLKATVIREGKKGEIDARELVPGDIIILETGDKIPADARLFESINLATQEASLTGESTPIKKRIEVLPEKTILADRKNMVYSGTIITGGRGKAVVTSTGMSTEIGKIATLIEETKSEPTPLQKKMNELGRWIGYVTIGISIVVFIVGLLFHKAGIINMLITAVSLAVAAIPEGLPAVVTITLAIGTQRMLKRHALIRRLPSVETLGSTTTICSDKTGTLTMNEMTVKRIYANKKIINVSGVGYETRGEFTYDSKKAKYEELELILRIGALNNNAELRSGILIGDPTEGALIVSAAKLGLMKENLESEFPRIDEIEFTSERKMMTTMHRHNGERIAYSKGAPDILLKKCNYILINGRVKELSAEDMQEILNVNEEFANEALRVLGFAYKTIVDTEPEKNMIFVGLQAMIDPPREEVKQAIQKCKEAGIRVIMITGDHEITARAVAREIGLDGRSITGAQIEELKELDKIIEDVSIFARVNPEHKIKIVDALKKKGHIVAMTGDGVNDAPALKKADIGIAMGITGTDVAKEASAMILTDDNFASIVNAVEEGRGIYDNIKKYFAFLVSGNIAEVIIIFFAILIGLPVPLTATQILLINLVTDGPPAIALSVDPFEPGAMQRKPRSHKEPIYKGLNAYILYYPIIMAIVALSIFSYVYLKQDNLIKAQTMAWLTIVMFELYQAFASRSTRYSMFEVGPFKNKWLVLAVLFSFITSIILIFVPALHSIFDTTSLSIMEFLFIIAISSSGAIVIEISKWYKTKKAISY